MKHTRFEKNYHHSLNTSWEISLNQILEGRVIPGKRKEEVERSRPGKRESWYMGELSRWWGFNSTCPWVGYLPELSLHRLTLGASSTTSSVNLHGLGITLGVLIALCVQALSSWGPSGLLRVQRNTWGRSWRQEVKARSGLLRCESKLVGTAYCRCDQNQSWVKGGGTQDTQRGSTISC